MKEVRLFINDREVEFKDVPAVLYNWAETDFTNPTVKMNSYSANITVEGTPNNDLIFGSYWNLERYNLPGQGFNPSYRVPFTMYVNGSVFESGYVKLQNVTVNGGVTNYEISLFGGLGQFLYNLSTDWNTGELKSLADLNLYQTPISETGYDYEDLTPLDATYTINKDTVATAWSQIETNSSKWYHINFAPCYNGLNDHMTNDKSLVNFNGLPTSVFPQSDARFPNFEPHNGYSLANLPEELTEWDTKDLRSWAQRPVIRTATILDAIRRTSNNKGRYDNGYKVILDDEFFYGGRNPYYDETFMTLPLLSDMEFYGETEQEAYTGGISATYSSRGWDEVDMVFNLSQPIDKYGVKVKATMRLYIESSTPVEGGGNLYPSAWYVNSSPLQALQNAYGVQVYASSSSGETAPVFATSNVAWCGYRSTGSYAVEPPNYNEMVSAGRYFPKGNPGVKDVNGYFTPKAGTVKGYLFNQPIELECELPVGTTCFRVNVQRVCNRTDGLKNKLSNTIGNISIPRNLYTPQYNGEILQDRNISIDYTNTSNFFSNREVTKVQMLSTDYTPADWLLAYCKTFGLYIWKEPDEDIIHIDTRNTFYRRNNVIDLQDMIDYSKDLKITPVAVDAGYYSMASDTEESGAYVDYKSKYGKEYGMKVIDTGYEFDANVKELIDIPIKGAVQVRGNGRYYFKPTGDGIQPYCFGGVTYPLWHNGSLASDESMEIAIERRDIPQTCDPFDNAYIFYDAFDKPMFCDSKNEPVDGANVFLFYTRNEDVNGLGYYLTDDLDIMATLNNNPCWITTVSTSDTAGNVIARAVYSIPKFSRYYVPGKKIMFSFDWGAPRQLYVPEMYYAEEATLYNQFYKTYLEDLYDINTRVLSCNVKFDKTLSQDYMRNIYWFRNGLWRLNRIEGYNPVSDDTVKCEFVKVQDAENLTSVIPDQNRRFVSAVPDKTRVPASGGVVTISVITNDGYGCSVDYQYSDLTFNPTVLTSDGTIQVTVPANWQVSARTFEIPLVAGNDRATVTFTQDADEYVFSVTASTLTPGSGQTTGTITITNPNNYDWILMDTPSWIWLEEQQGSTTETFGFQVDPNTTVSSRTGTVEIFEINYGQTYDLTFTQAAGARTISVDPVHMTVASGANTTNLYVTLNDDSASWSVTSIPSWASVPSPVYTGTTTVPVSFTQNTGGTRNSNLVITPGWAGGSAVTVPLTQNGRQQQLININFNPTGTIRPGGWGWSGWYLERVTISEYSNFAEGTSDYLYQYEPGLWLEYGDVDYNYMADGAFTMNTPSNWRGQNKTFYIFLEASDGQTGQYIRGSVTANINSLTNTNINLPSTDNTWYGPWSS